jgi:2-keto-4-pentenoate hydratase
MPMAGQDAEEIQERIARAFVAARKGAYALPDYPGPPPTSLVEAYAIQDHAIALWDDDIVGWKVGRIPPPQDAAFGTTRLCGPIFAAGLADAADRPALTVFTGGFGAIESEFLFKLGDVPAGKTEWSLDAALAVVDAVHLGFEVASSPFPGINALGSAVTISDFGNNNGLVIGPALTDWRDRALDRWPVTTLIDGVEIATGCASSFPDGSAGSVRALLENLAARGIVPPPGTWVSTGAVSGVHQIAAGQSAIARFADEQEIECHIVAAEPQAR